MHKVKKRKDRILLNNCPKEQYISIYYPNGDLLVKTNNEVLWLHIRFQIKEKKLNGFYYKIENDDTKYYISENGRIVNGFPPFKVRYQMTLKALDLI